MPTAEPKPIDVQLLALPETAASGLYGMLDVLRVAGALWRTISGADPGPTCFNPRIVASQPEPFRCGGVAMVEPDIVISPSNVPEVLVITDFWLALDDAVLDRHEELKAWLRHCWSNGATIYSACSGSIILAAAGLLDGRPATSHWAYSDLFDSAFPKVSFDPTSNLCFSDESGRLVTAGGAAAWHDLALHIISRHISPGEAIATAKFFLMKWHPEGQRPYANEARQRPHADSAVRRAESWLRENFQSPDPVSGAIAAVGVSERSLKRRFTQATGVSLIAYAQNLRVEAAKEALEFSRKSFEEIAADVGYDNVAFFRRLFKRCTGMSPTEYRRLYEPFWAAHSA
ncbi:MAG: helix-turn-helix domain-containing protein [Pseudomonadota bacterium]